MKYVIVKENNPGELEKNHVSVFHNSIRHKDIATAIFHTLRTSINTLKVYSAGFCSFDRGLRAYGDSESLGITSRVGDEQILQQFFEESGFQA